MATRATHTATLALVPVANTAGLRATQAATLAQVPVPNTARLRATHSAVLALTLAAPPAPPAPAAEDCSKVTLYTTLWRLEATDGTVIRATIYDQEVVYTYDGQTYEVIPLEPSQQQLTSGLSADNAEATVVLGAGYVTEAELLAGKWDYAIVELKVVDLADLTQAPVRHMVGHLGEVVARNGVLFHGEVISQSSVLNQPVGDLTSETCRIREFGGPICLANIGPFTHTTTVLAVTDKGAFQIGFNAPDATYFQDGKITFASGANSGLSMEIKSNDTAGNIKLLRKMIGTVAPGDAVTVVRGCPRTVPFCRDVMNNLINIDAEPDIPGPEKVYKWPE